MDSAGRRTMTRKTKTMVSVTTAGSLWDNRMKIDRVKGGIKVFNGNEISPDEDHGQEPRMRPKINGGGGGAAAAAAGGKRKAVKNIVAVVTNDKSKSGSESQLQQEQVDKTCIDASDSCCDCSDNDNDNGTGGDGGGTEANDQTGSPRPVGLKKTRSEPLSAVESSERKPASSAQISQLRKLKSEPNGAIPSTVNKIGDPNSKTEDPNNHGTRENPNSSTAGSGSGALSQSCKSDENNNKGLEFNPLEMGKVSLNKLDHEQPIDTHPDSRNQEKKQSQEEIEEAPTTTTCEGVDSVCKEIEVCHEEDNVITADHVFVDADGDRQESANDQRNKEIEIDIDMAVAAKTLNSVRVKETKIKRPVVTPSSIPSLHKAVRKGSSIASNATGSGKRISSHNKPTPNFPSPSPPQCKVSDDFCTSPEAHSRLQSLVDLVMWRDVSRSAFVFGIGTFLIISSSFAKDLDISLIAVASYSSLVYLAIVFLYRTIRCRGIIEEQNHPQINVLGEEEALWLVKLVLPYLNESLIKIKGLFSGDPAVTMKLALMLFLLAKCGSSITMWKMVKLGFFGAFVIPKLCSSYSTHITAYGKFWVRRFQDAWQSCSQKKAVAFAIFTLVWNFSSVVARAWAAFMLFVAFQYYQQSLATNDWAEDQTGLNDLQQRHATRRHRRKIPTPTYEKKSF